MFGGQVEKKEVSVLPLLEPNIYDGFNLSKIEFKPSVQKDNKEEMTKEALHFIFQKNQEVHTHVEYAISKEDEKYVSKAQNLTSRVYEILEAVSSFDRKTFDKKFDSFGDFCKWAASMKPNYRVKFKVVGSVYNGKRKASFPNYGNFIAREGSSSIKFSDKELLSNREYANFVPANSASPEDEFGRGNSNIDLNSD